MVDDWTESKGVDISEPKHRACDDYVEEITVRDGNNVGNSSCKSCELKLENIANEIEPVASVSLCEEGSRAIKRFPNATYLLCSVLDVELRILIE